MFNLKHRITPIRSDFLQQVRQQGIDDLGQSVEHIVAVGGEPCRDGLRRAKAGEALILASYCPFEKQGPYREYGPIFVFAQDQGSIDHGSVQVSAQPSDLAYLGAHFVLRAYSEQERIVDARLSNPENAESDLQALWEHAEVAFILVRFAAYGCYALRLDRGQSPSSIT